MAHHDVKCFTKNFEPLIKGIKKSTVRYNDRNYQIGDTITFREGQDTLKGFNYTGRWLTGMISYIDDFGCQFGYVNLSLDKLGMLRVQ